MQRFLPTLAGKVAFVDEGFGDPLVFVHGNPSWSYSFRAQIEEFARRYRVIVPDLLGFGDSEGPRSGASFREQAGVFDQVMGVLGFDQVRLVLHDWGGPVGLHWAAFHPGRVSKLVLINTTAAPRFRAPFYWYPLVAPFLGEVLVVYLNVFVRFLPLFLRTARRRTVYRRYVRGFARLQSRRAILRLERLEGLTELLHEVEDRCENLCGPCLIIWGEPDVYFQAPWLDDLRCRFPQARIVRLAGAGHFPFEESPAAFNAVLADFLCSEDGS